MAKQKQLFCPLPETSNCPHNTGLKNIPQHIVQNEIIKSINLQNLTQPAIEPQVGP